MVANTIFRGSIVALLIGLAIQSTSNGQKKASSLKFPVADHFLERLKSVGLQPNDEKKPFSYPSGAIKGSFRGKDSGTYPSIRYLYVYKDGNKSWQQKKGSDFEYKDPGVTAQFQTYWTSSYKHRSLESKVRKARTFTQQYAKSLGAPPEVEVEKYEQVTESTYESARRAGCEVERVNELKKYYTEWIAGIGGIRSVGNLSKLHPHAGPVKTTIVIRYPYEVTSFGKKIDAVLVVTLSVWNGINSPKIERINPDQIEDAAFWAIAEAVGLPEIAKVPDRGKTDKHDLAMNDREQPETPTNELDTDPKPPTKATSPTGGVFGQAFDILFHLRKVKQDLISLRSQLRALVVARSEEKQWLRNATETLKKQVNSPYTALYEEWVKESKAKLAEFDKEIKRLSEEGDLLWKGLRGKLDEAITAAKSHPDVLAELKLWHKTIDKLDQVSNLELLLAGGRIGQFKQLLPAALMDADLNERALELQATGLMEEGKYAEALYALRNSSKKYPQNPTLLVLMNSIEVNYLKLISAKTFDEGNRLRSAWDSFTAGSDKGFGMQLFSNGIMRGLHGVIGTTRFREELVKQRVSLASLQQNGIELMWRLRQRGLSFKEIKMIDTESLRKKIIEIAPSKTDIDDDVVEEMLTSLMAAFTHPDVENLTTDDKRLMQVNRDENYLGSDMLESSGWAYAAETVVDFASIKNVLIVFGPMTQVPKAGGAISQLAQRFGMSTAGRSAMLEQGSSLTVQEWIYARPALHRLAGKLGDTRAGQAINEVQHALRALRYDSSRPVRWATGTGVFATEVTANWLLAEGLGRVGKSIGGEYGQMAGEISASFIGVPLSGKLSRLEDRWQRSLTQMKQARKQWEVKELLLKTLRAPIREATESIAAGRTLTQVQRSTLTEAAAQLDELAGGAGKTLRPDEIPNPATTPPPAGSRTQIPGDATHSTLLQNVDEEARTLAANARATLAGNTDEALATSAASKTLKENSDELAAALNSAEDSVGKTVIDVEAPSATNTVSPQKTLLPDDLPLVKPDIKPQGSGKTGQAAFDDLLERAEASLKKGDFDEAVETLHFAGRHPKAKRGDVAEVLEQKLAEASAAQKMAADRLSKANSASAKLQQAISEADDALQPFTKQQMDHVNKLSKSDLKPLKGEGGAMQVPSADGSKALAVWKPAGRPAAGLTEEGQLLSEMLMTKLGRKLGLRIPHAQPHVIDGEPGVLIRWIPDSTDLEAFSDGAQIALKDQIAEFRPLQILIGNYDIHFGNYKVDSAGRLWAFDGGMSYLTPPPQDSVMFAQAQLRSGGVWALKDELSHNLNSTRSIRDLYSIIGKTSEIHRGVRRIDGLIIGSELRASAKKVQAITNQEIDNFVRELMEAAQKQESKEAAETILKTLKERRDNMALLLNERWADALPK